MLFFFLLQLSLLTFFFCYFFFFLHRFVWFLTISEAAFLHRWQLSLDLFSSYLYIYICVCVCFLSNSLTC